MVLKAKCPLCSMPAYQGFNKFECIKRECPNYSATLYKEQIPKDVDDALNGIDRIKAEWAKVVNNANWQTPIILSTPSPKFRVGDIVKYISTGGHDKYLHGEKCRVYSYDPCGIWAYKVDLLRGGWANCDEYNLEPIP
jgi:hypothetical protein